MDTARNKLDEAYNIDGALIYATNNAKDELPKMYETIAQSLETLQNSENKHLNEIAKMLSSVSKLEPFFQAKSYDLASEILTKLIMYYLGISFLNKITVNKAQLFDRKRSCLIK